jgi:hypothetical protein
MASQYPIIQPTCDKQIVMRDGFHVASAFDNGCFVAWCTKGEITGSNPFDEKNDAPVWFETGLTRDHAISELLKIL